jgi:hypothetical protein
VIVNNMESGEYNLKERAIIDVRKDELVKIH